MTHGCPRTLYRGQKGCFVFWSFHSTQYHQLPLNVTSGRVSATASSVPACCLNSIRVDGGRFSLLFDHDGLVRLGKACNFAVGVFFGESQGAQLCDLSFADEPISFHLLEGRDVSVRLLLEICGRLVAGVLSVVRA